MTPGQFFLSLAYALTVGTLFYVTGYLVGDRQPSAAVGWCGVAWGLTLSMIRYTRWWR